MSWRDFRHSFNAKIQIVSVFANFYNDFFCIKIMNASDIICNILTYSNLNPKNLSEKIGLDRPQAIYDIQKGKTKNISPSMADKIISVFPEINRIWLLTGEGEMLKESAPTKAVSEKKIPFYDVDVTASITESFHDMPDIPQYYIDFPPLSDCTAAFPVYGESMEPDFFAGEVVLVKEIRNVDSMLWGEPYLVITNANCDNLRTIKNVYLSEDRKKFILRATNPRFKGDTIVPLEDVLKIFLVKGKVNRRQL